MIAPTVAGGGLVCALGTHPGPALTAVAADLCRLEAIHEPRVQRTPIVVGRARGHDGGEPARHVMALLLDAIERARASMLRFADDGLAVVVGWPDPGRPGAPPRPSVADLADRIGAQLGLSLDPERVRCLTGETAGARALAAATHLLADDDVDACLVAAADSWLTVDALAWLADRSILRWRPSADGMAPAEAGAAVWLARTTGATGEVRLTGVGSAVRTSGPPTRELGHAITHALGQAHTDAHRIDHAVIDAGSDAWGSIKASLALSRCPGPPFVGARWIPADALGHVGAAAGLVSVLLASHLLGRYGEGGTGLCIATSREDGHVATVLAAERSPDASLEEPIPWAR